MNLGKLVQIVKEYVTYTQYSDERLLNDMLACFVITYDLKLHNSEEPLYFDKSYTSKIVRNSVRIPPQLCGVINDNTQGKAYEYFCRFYTKHITGEKGKRLREVLLSVISSDNSFPDTTKNILSETTNDCRFLYLCMISALRVENNLKRNYECETIIYENGNNYLRVVAGDIFRYAFPNRKKSKTIVVIPVNTRFDTILSTKIEKTPDPMISSETIHGEWLLRLEKRGEDIETIKSRIKADLSARGVNSNDAGEYPIGTIAPIDFENTCFFLLAISRFDTHNRALSNKEFIQTSVKELMEFYDINGQGYEMFMPLLGTGRVKSILVCKFKSLHNVSTLGY